MLHNVLVLYFVPCLFLLILWIFCLYGIVKCSNINYPATVDPIPSFFPGTILVLWILGFSILVYSKVFLGTPNALGFAKS